MFVSKLVGPDRVSDAAIDSNGYVRVNTRDNTNVGIALEMHRFFTAASHDGVGYGPFIGVQAGTSNVINAIGIGFMVGFKLGTDAKSHTSLNLGIGYAGVPAAKSLGNEFVEDQKAPVDTAGKPLPIRYETHDAGGIMMMASFTF